MSPIVYRYVSTAAATPGVALLLGTAMSPEKTSASDARSSKVAVSDTLQAPINAGSPFLMTLPDSSGAANSILRAHTLSRLTERSLMGNTSVETSGRHERLLEPSIGETTDTRFLLIAVD